MEAHGFSGVAAGANGIPTPFGVNVSGLLTGDLGLGQAARLLVRALDEAGIPCALNNVVLQGHRAGDQSFAGRFVRAHPYAVNLCCLNPDALGPFYRLVGPGYFRPPDSRRYNIAYWNWESERPPAAWASYCSLFDELWAPSRYTAAALSRAGPTPVTVVPYPIESEPVATAAPRSPSLAAGRFNFLYVFDFNSTVLRKNPAALARAFNLAFPPDRPDAAFPRPPGLTLKARNAARNVTAKLELLELLRPQRAHPGRAVLIDEDWDRDRVATAIRGCDVYVSPHRAEGFGLTVAEAMACARPVVMCSYSGAAELAPESCYFPIRHTLQPMAAGELAYDAGTEWAEIDERDLADTLLRIIADPAGAAAAGRRGERHVREHFGLAAIGRRIRQELADRIYPSLS